MESRAELMLLEDPKASVRDQLSLRRCALFFSSWLQVPIRIEQGGRVKHAHPSILILGIRREEQRCMNLDLWKIEALECSTVPVILVPPGFSTRFRKIDSFFVPISGEEFSHSALDWTIRVGSNLGIAVDVLHASPDSHARRRRFAPIWGDQAHLEYGRGVEQFFAAASPYTSRRQKRSIRRFQHVLADPDQVLPRIAKRVRRSLTVLEWHGYWGPGRASLVKAILSEANLPVALIRQAGSRELRLRTCDQFLTA